MSWSGAAECTGLGVGYGVFDAVYVPAEGELPEVVERGHMRRPKVTGVTRVLRTETENTVKRW